MCRYGKEKHPASLSKILYRPVSFLPVARQQLISRTGVLSSPGQFSLGGAVILSPFVS